ncbi:hypothetical protein ANCCAN_09086, partial [Ancylostoma caninum]
SAFLLANNNITFFQGRSHATPRLSWRRWRLPEVPEIILALEQPRTNDGACAQRPEREAAAARRRGRRGPGCAARRRRAAGRLRVDAMSV